MFLKALDTIHVSSVSSDNIISGQTFEIDDLRGRSLIERGLAIEVDAAAAAKPEPAAKAEAQPVNPLQAEEITEQSPIANKAGAHTRKKVV
ncbi:hypothetical protein [Novosphingobium sp.]|uniref:hypothetical protein n=1 Tax=Novosphingobium sp. TaxID=1874826 RepID=UPI0035B08FDB